MPPLARELHFIGLGSINVEAKLRDRPLLDIERTLDESKTKIHFVLTKDALHFFSANIQSIATFFSFSDIIAQFRLIFTTARIVLFRSEFISTLQLLRAQLKQMIIWGVCK